MFKRLITALLALAIGAIATSALAQNALQQSGSWTPGRSPMYSGGGFSQPIVTDSGPAGGGGPGVGLAEQLLVARGTGTPPYAAQGSGPFGTNWCNYDAPITNATGGHYICFSPNAGSNELLAIGSFGGATPLPLVFNINGVNYPFPSGYPYPTVTSNTALSALASTFSPYVLRLGFATAGDSPETLYAPSNSLCTLNAGQGDGASQVPIVNASSGVVGCWNALFTNQVSAASWGVFPTNNTTTNTTRLQYFVNYVCSLKQVTGRIPTGTYFYNSISFTMPSGGRCTIKGDGQLQTILASDNLTGVDWTITGTGSQQFNITDLSLEEDPANQKTAGWALELTDLYLPSVQNVNITGWNGIWNNTNATAKLVSVNFVNLDGTEGIYISGVSNVAQVFGGVIDKVTGTTVSTNHGLIWLDMDSYSNSITVQYAAFEFGGTCVRMRDSSGGGVNVSAPNWMFIPHIECDHNYNYGVDLEAGIGFSIGTGSWLGSTIAGPAFYQNTGWTGQTVVEGTRINGAAQQGVVILGGVDTKIVNNTITANGWNGSGTHYDEVYVGATVSSYTISKNYIDYIGDADSSQDNFCINTNSSSGSNIDISYNKGMICFEHLNGPPITAIPTGTNVTVNYNDNDKLSQGTWTPVVAGSSTAGTFTGTALGYYQIVGSIVTVNANITITGISGSPTGNTLVKGLPYESSLTAGQIASCSIGLYGGVTLDTGYTQLGAAVLAQETVVNLYENGSTESLAFLPIGKIGSSSNLALTCSYMISP